MEKTDHVTRLMLVDDHAMVREGLRVLLEGQPIYRVRAEASTAREAISRVAETPVDLVLMDVSMPGMDGIEAAAQLSRIRPELPVLMLSMHATESHARRALEAGARGYCVKRGGRAELVGAIAAVLEGKTYVSAALAAGGALDASFVRRLTRRQTEILELIALSYTSKEIARHLSISMKTVESHRTALMRQLDLHDLAGLVRYAIRIGLVAADAQRPGPDKGCAEVPHSATA